MKGIMIFTMLVFLFCLSDVYVSSKARAEKENHSLAENIIEWSPDKIFFQMIDMKDSALFCVRDKISKYREFLIDECARKSAKKIEEEEFNTYKIKISKCSDTENLILFISKLRKYQGDEGELVFDGGIF